MEHRLIPARDKEISEALTEGQSIAAVAARWNLGEQYVRNIAKKNGVRLERRRSVDPTKAYRPSPEAREVLVSVDIDPDTIPGRHLVCTSRDAEIIEMLLIDAATLDEVGRTYGLTRERVRQIQVRYLGVSAKTFHARRSALAAEYRAEKITSYAAGHPEATGREIADGVDVPLCEVRAVIGPDQMMLRERPSNKGLRRQQDNEVLAEIQRIARLRGGVPLRSTFYDAHRLDGMIGSVRIEQRFGTWRQACEAAGVAPMPSQRLAYTRRWATDDLQALLDRYVIEAWGTWSYARFEAWLRRQDGAPSAQTVRNQLGEQWQELLQGSLRRARAEQTAQS